MKKKEHFHQRSVKVGGGYGKIQTVTVCGKQEKMSRLMNNINSIRRESLGNKSPYEATTDKSILRLMELMGLHTVPADEVNLTPAQLKR